MASASDIEQQAATWLVRRDGGALSAQAMADFQNWLTSDRRHRATFLRLEEAWRLSDNLRRVRPLDEPVNEDLLEESPFLHLDERGARASTKDSEGDEPDDLDAPGADLIQPQPDPSPFPARTTRQRLMPYFASAAAVAAIAVAAGLWYQFKVPHWKHYATDLGGFERISLTDGSTVHLNTNSALRVLMTNLHRQVVLERGEALFKVSRDTSRPFDVDAAGTTVRAMGTEFSVRVREKEESSSGLQNVEVFVREGKVAVDSSSAHAHATVHTAPAAVPTLKAGETVTVSAQRMYIAKVPDVSRKLAWIEGRLWFERQRLVDVVAEFNRYNRVQMLIVDPAIDDLRIGGMFEATDIASFTAALERSLPVVKVDRSDPLVMRLSAARKFDAGSGDGVPELPAVSESDVK